MRLFLLLSILLLSLSLKAQVSSSKESKKTPIIIPSLVFGQSMPFGNYASISIPSSSSQSEGSGFADPGLAYDFGVMFMAGPSFGITLTFSNFVNPVSESRLTEYLLSNFYYEPSVPTITRYKLDVGNWRNNAFLIGIAYKMNQKKVSFDLNLKFGMLSSTSPSFRIDTISDSGAQGLWYSSSSNRNFGLATSIGFQFRIMVVKSLYLNMTSSFLVSTYQLRQEVYPSSSYPYPYYDNVGAQMNIGTFNLMMGISYEFELK